MKLATMTSVCPDWDLPTIVECMLRHGYTGLEPRVGWGHRAGLETDLSAAARTEARRRLEDSGLAVCCVASGARFAATAPAERRASLEEARRCIELAGAGWCAPLAAHAASRGSSIITWSTWWKATTKSCPRRPRPG